MWAAAALQNLAASYCDTDDGRCYWRWSSSKENHVILRSSSRPVLSDGSAVRTEALAVPGLVQALTRLACQGPVVLSSGKDEPSDDNVFPGENAIAGRDETNPHIVAWAAAGALKNLALEPSAANVLELALPCLCRLAQSPDWLEKAKGRDALKFLRRGAHPCWFRKQQRDGSSLCMDGNFLDEEKYTCDGYEQASADECHNARDVFTGVRASEACCGCGGGRTVHLD